MDRIVFLILLIFFLFVSFQHLIPDIIALLINILPYFIKILPFIVLGGIVFIILNIRKRRKIFDINKLSMNINNERTNTQYPKRQLPSREYQGTPPGRQYRYDQIYNRNTQKRLNF